MDHKDLASLTTWFVDYCSTFATPIPEDQRNLTIKQDHTREVRLNAARLCREQGLPHGDALLAETVALFHDLGRFEQYQRFRTFDDSISANHAALGVRVLLERKVLGCLAREEQDLITRAVALHNVFALPPDLDPRTLLHCRLIRDADKLDILRVVIEYFTQDEGERAEAVGLGLRDDPGWSATVLEALLDGRMARKSELATLNDFKLLQLAWLYDLNFAASLEVVLERGYIDRLAALLPGDAGISEAIGSVRAYATRRLAGGL